MSEPARAEAIADLIRVSAVHLLGHQPDSAARALGMAWELLAEDQEFARRHDVLLVDVLAKCVCEADVEQVLLVSWLARGLR
jgi:hypothetical protein